MANTSFYCTASTYYDPPSLKHPLKRGTIFYCDRYGKFFILENDIEDLHSWEQLQLTNMTNDNKLTADDITSSDWLMWVIQRAAKIDGVNPRHISGATFVVP